MRLRYTKDDPNNVGSEMLLLNAIRRLANDRRGNFLLIFALLLLPLVGVLGVSVDYALLDRVKTSLDASNDEAVLSAVTEAVQTIENGGTSPNTSAAISIGQAAGLNTFNADSARARTTATPVYNIALSQSGLTITAVGTYTAQSPNVFGGIFGVTVSNVSGKATASLTLPKYVNIYMVTDISQSMGIGASATDQTLMVNNTPDSCQFGCHVSDVAGKSDDEDLAHAAGATLRIDVVKKAIESIVTNAANSPSGSNRINLAIYTMDTSLHTLAALQSAANSATLTAAAATIDLGSTTAAGPGDSYQTAAPSGTTSTLSQLVSSIPAGGDGTSASKPQTFIFIMTDGVTDYQVGLTGTCATNQSGAAYTGHCSGVFDGTSSSSPCTIAKNNNINVGVIYTVYVPFPTDPQGRYQSLVEPFQTLSGSSIVTDQMQTAMSACSGATTGTGASSGTLFYAATDTQEILNAGQSLFLAATAQTALTL